MLRIFLDWERKAKNILMGFSPAFTLMSKLIF